MLVKKAMILAAGKGERLRPITDTTPKPLIRVGTQTLIEHHLDALLKSGFTDVVINLAHLGDQIRDYLGNGLNYGLKIIYSEEPDGALETAGGIHHALPLLGDQPFLVINGDIRCNLDFSTISLPANQNMHLIMVQNPPHHPEGDFWLDSAERPGRLLMTSSGSPSLLKVTFSGIGLYRPSLFREMSSGRAPLAPLIQQQISLNCATAELFEGYWSDIGTADRLAQARSFEETL